MTIYSAVCELIEYAIQKKLIFDEDRAYATGRIMEALALSDFETEEVTLKRELHEILDDICDYAYVTGLIPENSVVYKDLFDTKIMGLLTERPSNFISHYTKIYEKNPQAATDYFYNLAKDTNYIRVDRIKKDMKWTVDSEYGKIDVTINLSKPEKDPKAIAAAKLLPQSGYPKCLLCHENEGFAGTISKPARQTLRQIPLTLGGEKWYMQYSPYVYYNEHCILLSSEHTPMKISRATFVRQLDFLSVLPHYFIGSNADLPIVGGSILSHDHMQGGKYTFAMDNAKTKQKIKFQAFSDVKAEIIKWPLSVIRLRGKKKERLAELADKILTAWRGYSDGELGIFASTNGEMHNTVTPIARRRGQEFELDLVLRNNITTAEHPLGLFHPHAELHNIKKENIGLIEVMGLAVLPSRLLFEISDMRNAILENKDFSKVESIEKHRDWFLSFKDKYVFTEENTEDILKDEIGKTFVRVLCHAGVYKDTDEGLAGLLRFVDFVNIDLQKKPRKATRA